MAQILSAWLFFLANIFLGLFLLFLLFLFWRFDLSKIEQGNFRAEAHSTLIYLRRLILIFFWRNKLLSGNLFWFRLAESFELLRLKNSLFLFFVEKAYFLSLFQRFSDWFLSLNPLLFKLDLQFNSELLFLLFSQTLKGLVLFVLHYTFSELLGDRYFALTLFGESIQFFSVDWRV